MKKPKPRINQVPVHSEYMIHIKSKAEINRMRDAGKLAAELLLELGNLAKEGVSTHELNEFAHRYTIKHGAESAPLNYRGFPKSICTSINDVVCHGIPSKKDILKKGDIMNIDVTVKLNGYHGDTSSMFTIEPISAEAQRLLLNAHKSLYIGIGAVIPGNRVSDIGMAIDNFLTPKGFGIVRDLTGHGIGRNFHEDPSIPHYKQNKVRNQLKPGMTFTVEPMVNQGDWRVSVNQADGWTVRTADGSLSAQYEHTCLVTDDGCEILTRPKELFTGSAG